MQLDIERQSQVPFQVFMGLKSHADETLLNMQDYIERNTEEKITVDILAAKCNMARVNFSRRFKRATQLSPIHHIQQVKIDATERELETGAKTLTK